MPFSKGLTQESNPGLLHCRQILYQLSCKGSPYIYMCVCVRIYIYTPRIYITGSLCYMPEPNTSLFCCFLLLPSIGAQVAHSAVLASAAQQSEPAVPAHRRFSDLLPAEVTTEH